MKLIGEEEVSLQLCLITGVCRCVPQEGDGGTGFQLEWLLVEHQWKGPATPSLSHSWHPASQIYISEPQGLGRIRWPENTVSDFIVLTTASKCVFSPGLLFADHKCAHSLTNPKSPPGNG